MNNCYNLIKPRYVLKTSKGYLEYTEYNDELKQTEYGYNSSILEAKDYSYGSVVRVQRILKKRGLKSRIIQIEGI